RRPLRAGPVAATGGYSPPLRVFHLDFEHVDGIHIGAAEGGGALRLAGDGAAVAEDIHIGEGHVHGHGAQLPPLGVEVVAVPHLVAPVAAALAQAVAEGNADSGPIHHNRLLAAFPHHIIVLWMLSPPWP